MNLIFSQTFEILASKKKISFWIVDPKFSVRDWFAVLSSVDFSEIICYFKPPLNILPIPFEHQKVFRIRILMASLLLSITTRTNKTVAYFFSRYIGSIIYIYCPIAHLSSYLYLWYHYRHFSFLLEIETTVRKID